MNRIVSACFSILALFSLGGCSIAVSILGSNEKTSDFVLSSQYQTYTNVTPWLVQLKDNIKSGKTPTTADFNVVNGSISSITEISPGLFEISVTPTADGSMNLELKSDFTNSSTSPSATTISVVMDRAQPNITLSSSAGSVASTQNIDITVTADEDLSALTPSEFTVTNGQVLSVTGSGQSYTATVKATTEGSVSVKLNADATTDLAGNKNLSSNTLSWQYNQAPPLITISSASSFTNANPVTVTFTSTEEIANFTAADISVTNGTLGTLTKVDATHYTIPVTPSSSGDVQIDIAAQTYEDLLGLENDQASTYTFNFNDARPTVTLSSLSTWDSATSVDVSVTFSESVTGFTTSDLSLTNATAVITGVGASYIVTLYPTAQGAYSVQVVNNAATDKWGNLSQASSTVSSIYDTAVPSLTISSSTSTNTNVSPIPLQFTFSETVANFVVGDITATNGAVSNFVKVDNTHYTADLTPSGQGTVSVTVDVGTYEDIAGRTNIAASSLSRSYDNVAPTVTLSAMPSYTGGTVGSPPRSVTVTLSEAVTTFDLTKITLTNATATLTGSGTSYTLSITPIIEGTFSASVAAGVLSDASGNTNTVSNTSSSVYDTTPPVATVTADAGSFVFDSPISFTIKFNEPVTAINMYALTVTNYSGLSMSSSADGMSYILKVTPSGSGNVSVTLPAGIATNNVGLSNTAATGGTTYYDNVPVTVNFSQSEITLAEDTSASQNLNLTMSATKPYNVRIYYHISGTGVYGTDHNLQDSYVDIPSGSTTAQIPYSVLHNTGTTANRYAQVSLFYPNSPAIRFTRIYQTRILIKDVDGGTRPDPVFVAFTDSNKCVIDSNGKMVCWGPNSAGQLGDGTTVGKSSAVTYDSGTAFISAATSLSGTCGITTSNDLRCSGRAGAIGKTGITSANYATVNSSPSSIDSGVKYSKVQIGNDMGCGLVLDGTMKCWGQMPATANYYSGPTAITGIGTVIDFSVGSNYMCAVNSGYDLYCWGTNFWGHLGNNSTTSETAPVLIGSGYKTVMASTDYTTCALTTGNEIYCWGMGSYGNIGNGASATAYVPTKVSGTDTFKGLYRGRSHMCGITSSDVLKCWGRANAGNVAQSALGDGTASNRNIPTTVSDSEVYTQLEGGAFGTCGITVSKKIKCWGEYDDSYLGDGTLLLQSTSFFADPLESYSSVASGSSFSCGITTAGLLKCWGYDITGTYSLGDGTTVSRGSPIVVDSGQKYIKVSTGGNNTCGIREDNFLYCWGDGTNGRLGAVSSNRLLPGRVETTLKFKDVTVGPISTCAITTDDKLYCWGDNVNGNAGIGFTSWTYYPTAVDSTNSYKKVSVGQYNSCGITTSGALYCWGLNSIGEVGDGTSTKRSSPVIIMSGTSFTDVSVGEQLACAITDAKKLYCWGYGVYWGLGLGSSTSYNTPQAVQTGTDFVSVDLSRYGACAKTDAGPLKCWGASSVSPNTGPNATTPTAFSDTTTFDSYSVGHVTSCGIISNKLKCWGSGANNSLADDSLNRTILAPVDVTSWIIP